MPELLTYKCPYCGGGIEFEASAQRMQCPFCDAVFDREAILEMEKEQKNAGKDGEENRNDAAGEADYYVCSACGGEIIAGPNTAATRCPYCDNPVLLNRRLQGKWEPELIVPFRVTKRAAVTVLKRFTSEKPLVPKLFSNENHLEEMQSVYVPFWIYDAAYHADITYSATKTRSWSDRKYDYTETSYFRVARAGTVRFRNVPVDASSRMPDDLMDSLEPFRLEDAVPFQREYLAGYLADKYDVDPELCMNRAHTRMQNTAKGVFRNTAKGYDTLRESSEESRYLDIRPRYALLPVWLLRTEWEGKKYLFAMNGQTGKFIGELPMDNKAYWTKRLIYAGIIAAALFLLSILFLSVGSLLALPFILLIAFFAGDLPLLGAKKAIRNVKLQTTAWDYTGNGDLSLERAEDVYLRKTLTKTRRDDK